MTVYFIRVISSLLNIRSCSHLIEDFLFWSVLEREAFVSQVRRSILAGYKMSSFVSRVEEMFARADNQKISLGIYRQEFPKSLSQRPLWGSRLFILLSLVHHPPLKPTPTPFFPVFCMSLPIPFSQNVAISIASQEILQESENARDNIHSAS